MWPLSIILDQDSAHKIKVHTIEFIQQLETVSECRVWLAEIPNLETRQSLQKALGSTVKCQMQIRHENTILADQYQVIGCQYVQQNNTTALVIRAVANVLPPEHQKPHYRIYPQPTIHAVLQSFPFFKMPTYAQNLLNHEYAEHGFFVQFGQSDWEFAQALLSAHNAAFPDKAMSWTGDLSSPQFQIISLLSDNLSGIAEHQWESEGYQLEDFDHLVSRYEPQQPWVPVSIFYRSCTFQPQNWEGQAKKQIPFLFQNHNIAYLVTKRVEKIKVNYGSDHVDWFSYIYAVPKDWTLGWQSKPSNISRPIFGGKVLSQQGQRVEIELENFESNYSTVSCYPFSLYTGKNEKHGVGLIPEPDTRTLVVIFPEPSQPVMPLRYQAILLGNIRHHVSELSGLFIYLEKTFFYHFESDLYLLSDLNVISKRDINLTARKVNTTTEETHFGAEKKLTLTSDESLEATSKTMSLQAEDKLTMEGTNSLTAKSKETKLEGTNSLTAKGKETTIQAQQSGTLSGGTELKMSQGANSIQISGGQIQMG